MANFTKDPFSVFYHLLGLLAALTYPDSPRPFGCPSTLSNPQQNKHTHLSFFFFFLTISFDFSQVNLWKEETKLPVFLFIIILRLPSACHRNYPYQHLPIRVSRRASKHQKDDFPRLFTSVFTSLFENS